MEQESSIAECGVCFRRCRLACGQTGFCRARICRGGRVVPKHYGLVSSCALDPIEKKPLARFFPGSSILSLGGFGCNMRCFFCQNHEISQADFSDNDAQSGARAFGAIRLAPEEAVSRALALRSRGNIGLAFTYNEPLVCWEYARDAARLAREQGLKNVVVTNGSASPAVWEALLPYIDAVNIDLKCFTKEGYRSLEGNLDSVLAAIRLCAARCHTEVATLVVPGLSDSEKEIEDIARFLAALPSCDGEIVLHLTRFFPRWKAEGLKPTDKGLLLRLADVARRRLPFVMIGNC